MLQLTLHNLLTFLQLNINILIEEQTIEEEVIDQETITIEGTEEIEKKEELEENPEDKMIDHQDVKIETIETDLKEEKVETQDKEEIDKIETIDPTIENKEVREEETNLEKKEETKTEIMTDVKEADNIVSVKIDNIVNVKKTEEIENLSTGPKSLIFCLGMIISTSTSMYLKSYKDHYFN